MKITICLPGLFFRRHSFVALMQALFQAIYHAVITIITMIINLFPLVDGFLHVCRFLLDKSLEICHTEGRKEKICKILLFIGEIFILSLVIMLIICMIVLPVWALVSYLMSKICHILIPSSIAVI